jgi:hypothetical protein
VRNFYRAKRWSIVTLLALGCTLLGCGGIFNDAFVNTIVGGVVPVTPGPVAAFVFVRGNNRTGQVVEFIVTVEKQVLVLDEQGNPTTDDQGNFITTLERQTVSLVTNPTGRATDLGVLFDCSVEPVTLIGLGENLLPTDPAVFVGGQGSGGAAGFGVLAPNLNPLSLEAGNFECGDTIIFEAFQSFGVPGGVSLQTYRLSYRDQPGQFSGPSTFDNYADFLESQVREDED